MRSNDQSSRGAIVTPSGKQIMLQNDIERVFSSRTNDVASPHLNRETPQEVRNSLYFPTPGDFDFKNLSSPMMYGMNFSPFRVNGVNFFETFSRRFRGRPSPGREEGLNPTGEPVESGGRVSRFEDVIPEMIEPVGKTVLPAPTLPSAHKKEVASEPTDSRNNTPSSARVEIFQTQATVPQQPPKPQEPAPQPVPEKPKSKEEPKDSQKEKPMDHLAAKPAMPIYFNCDISKYGNSLVKLKELFKVLNKVFNHKPIPVDEYVNLVPFEEELLNSMLQRKFMKKLRVRDFELEADKKVDLINEIIQTKSHKRPEECYKFILTRVIKHLKKHLKSTGCANKDLEEQFYEVYFSATARELGLPITDFHYPLTGNKGQFKLNAKYFDRIFKSANFMERLYNYLEGMLERDYKIEIAKKLESLLMRWDNTLMEAGANAVNVENSIREYLLKNKRCKLPWTIHEVLESIERFRNLLKNFPTLNKVE